MNFTQNKKKIFATLAICGILLSNLLAQEEIPKKLVPDKEYSAEQILNNDLPRRKPSPKVPFYFDDKGFAKDRLYSVPPAGIHPRIFFGPNDIPRIKKQLEETESGRQMLEYVREQLAKGIDKQGTWENQLFTALERGDIESFNRMTNNDVQRLPGNAAPPPPNVKPATSWHHRDSFQMGLMLKALVNLLDDNKESNARVGKVLANYTRWLEPLVVKYNNVVGGEDYWRGARRIVGEHAFFAYTYDFAYNSMTKEDQAQVRQTISTITKGRYVLGMNLPAHWRNWNWLPIGQYFTLISLAIEGEEGYDPRVYQRGVEVVQDFLTYGIDENGFSDESVGYTTAGTTHLSEVMLAMANRGNNFFTHSHYRRHNDQWLLWTLQPYGIDWISDGDLGNFPPGLEPVMFAKYFYPNDPKIDFVYQNLEAVRTNNYKKDWFIEGLLLAPADPNKTGDGKLVDYQDGQVFNLPNTVTDDKRGVTITRSDWTKDALELNFEVHPDSFMASHDHCDKGRFTLSALGRNWAREDARLIDTKDHSSILIDGVGQGYFATIAKWLGAVDTPLATFASGDAKYAYDWKWSKQIMMWSPDDARLDTPYYQAYKEKVAAFDRTNFEYDPSPRVVAYWKEYLDGNPLMWDEDSWVVRATHNPVQRAFRSAGLVRGKNPYVLIVDDIQKDNAEHLYNWLLAVPNDLKIVSQKTSEGFTDIILGEKSGNRQLLVRVLNAANADKSPAPYLENYDTKIRNIFADRLVIPSQSVAPDYKVLLFPHHQGDALPTTKWNTEGTKLTVEWTGQKDEYDFTKTSEGRSLLTLKRDGKDILATK